MFNGRLATVALRQALHRPAYQRHTALFSVVRSASLAPAPPREPRKFAEPLNTKEKYAEKLRQRAEKEGASVDDLLARARTPPPSPAVETPLTPPASPTSKPTASAPAPAPAKKPRSGGLPSHVKTLAELTDLDRLRTESPETITKIWATYHAEQDTLCATIPAAVYARLSARAKQFPMFVLPLPRDSGYEFFVMQFAGHQVFFTPLLEYQTHVENARPMLVITHHTDLAADKGIVLMRGDPADPKQLTLPQAQNLVYQMQMFYVAGPPEKLNLVDKFHKDPGAFDYKELIDAVNTLA
ncbi:ATP synthase mitochondrial F1 complex assembly factor 1 [Thoreauomyces humboldtii]|nr:ATP synthase mitochondrial F1 complex assembly factor 1 [Thoreauomyces humboldtii]